MFTSEDILLILKDVTKKGNFAEHIHIFINYVCAKRFVSDVVRIDGYKNKEIFYNTPFGCHKSFGTLWDISFYVDNRLSNSQIRVLYENRNMDYCRQYTEHIMETDLFLKESVNGLKRRKDG